MLIIQVILREVTPFAAIFIPQLLTTYDCFGPSAGRPRC